MHLEHVHHFWIGTLVKIYTGGRGRRMRVPHRIFINLACKFDKRPRRDEAMHVRSGCDTEWTRLTLRNSLNDAERLWYGTVAVQFGVRYGMVAERSSINGTERLQYGMTSTSCTEFGERYGTALVRNDCGTELVADCLSSGQFCPHVVTPHT